MKDIIMGNGYGVFGYSVLETFLLGYVSIIKIDMSKRTNIHNVIQNPDDRVAILEQVVMPLLIQIRRVLTFRTPGTSDTCISSSLRLSGSSGRGSAAALTGLVQKRMRFARKPLMKMH